MDGVDLTPYVTDTERMHSPHKYLFFRGGAATAFEEAVSCATILSTSLPSHTLKPPNSKVW